MFIEKYISCKHINDITAWDRWDDITNDGWENLTSIDSTSKKTNNCFFDI